MPRQKPTDKMEALRQKQSEIANQIKLLEARASETARKEDARRKIIAGALAIEHMEKNAGSEFGKVMFRLLDEYVEPRSRYLFPDLPAKSDTPAPKGRKRRGVRLRLRKFLVMLQQTRRTSGVARVVTSHPPNRKRAYGAGEGKKVGPVFFAKGRKNFRSRREGAALLTFPALRGVLLLSGEKRLLRVRFHRRKKLLKEGAAWPLGHKNNLMGQRPPQAPPSNG